METNLTRRLNIRHPIIQAPMAGGGSTPELAAAVSEAGGLGFLAVAYQNADEILAAARVVRQRTQRPFGINLFAPVPQAPSTGEPSTALNFIQTFHDELKIPAPSLPTSSGFNFHEQCEAAMASGASVFSFTFGILPPQMMTEIKRRGIFLIGTATTVQEAVKLEEAGVDAVVAQGSEAGAHRGTFDSEFEAALIGTVALVPQVVDAVRVPVIASGGIMDGRGIAAALALGADAVQMGTAFLTCDESGIPDVYKNAILHAREDHTRITRAFSGRPARGIVNEFLVKAEQTRGAILSYPIQNALTRPMRVAAAKQGRSEFLSLWAGQGVRLARRQPADELVKLLSEEANAVVKRLSAMGE